MIILKKHIGIILILLIAGFLRFYNLMHDAPYFFNPDERNMASAITQFHLPSKLTEIPNCLYSEFLPSLEPNTLNLKPENCTLNPHFFAYGQFPLYLAYLSDQVTQPFNHITIKPSANITQPTTNDQTLMTSFSSAIYWLRFWSALASVLTVLMVYKVVRLLFKHNRHPEFDSGSSSLKMLKQVFDRKAQTESVQHDRKLVLIAYFAALLTAFIPGLIQSAHFGTTESLLTFFFLCSLYFSLKLFNNVIPVKTGIQSLKDGSRVTFAKLSVNKPGMTIEFNTKYLLLASLSVGLAIGSKMTGAFFLVPPCLAISFHFLWQKKKTIKDIFLHAVSHLRVLAFFLIASAFFAVISSPYNLVQPDNFLSAVFGYEADVARGKYEAFYTRQFVHTTPILFQFEKIFPYSLGIVLTILGSIGFLILTIQLISQTWIYIRNKKSKKDHCYLLFVICYLSFLIYLIPNAFLFAKWSRFMTPILPFFVLFAMYLFDKIVKLKRNKFLIVICYLLFVISLLQGLAFFSIYTHEDSRFTASRWIYQKIPSDSYVLSETANVIDIPIPPPSPTDPSTEALAKAEANAYNLSPVSFDFYHLDESPQLQEELILHLEKADYIFIPSRRIFANYTQEPDNYPILNRYYNNLFNGNLGFVSVAEISSFPSLCLLSPVPCPLSFPDESAEETYTVFDHPVVRIYKKNESKTASEYQKLLL